MPFLSCILYPVSRILCPASCIRLPVRRRISPLLLPFLLLLTAGASAFDPMAFAYRKAVQVDVIGAEDVLAATLDSDVYAASTADGRDLRIVDDRGIEVPRLLRRREETVIQTVRQPVAARTVGLRELPGNRLDIELELEERSPAVDGFTVDTPLRDFERTLSVLGSRDGQLWKELVTNTLIFDYTRYLDYAQHDVRLPVNASRRFKIEIGNVADDVASPLTELTREFRAGQQEREARTTSVLHRPFRVDRVRFWRNQEQEKVRRPDKIGYAVVDFRVTVQTKPQQTLIDIGLRREPITAFTLVTSSRNFSRTVRLQVPQTGAGREDWRDLASGTLASFQFRSLHREWLKFEFAPLRVERCRLVIENGDNPALEIRDLRAEGEAYELLFLPVKGCQYALVYGAPDVKAPVYDTAQVLAGIGSAAQVKKVTLGPQTAQAGAAGRPWWRSLNRQWLFGAAIVLMVAVLAWGLFRAGKRVDQVQ